MRPTSPCARASRIPGGWQALRILLPVLLLATSGANCLWPWQVPDGGKPARQAALRGFGSAEELRQFLAEQAKARLTSSQTDGGGWFWGLFPFAAPMAAGGDAMADRSNEATGGGETSYSSTTIQEAGVDESDVVKNNGQTIFWLRGDTIHVVSAVPAENMQELSTVKLETTGDALYLRGHQVVAITGGWPTVYPMGGAESAPGGSGSSGSSGDTPVSADTAVASLPSIGGPWYDGSQALVTVIDATDPLNPSKQATLRFEGQLATSRLIGNRLYLVLTTTPQLPVDPTPAAIEDMTLEEWLPGCEVKDGSGVVQSSGSTTAWDGFYRPIAGDGYAITTVVTIDLDDPGAEFASTAITASADIVYASRDALYITDPKYDWDLRANREDTIIHKLAFVESGTQYVASGLVPGRPLNQYSLGEYDGYLRIATTQDVFSILTGGESTNGVYVLGVDGSDLKVVGKVEDLGIGEQIYAARFLGPRGFVVTFQRIDPLFALDLSDPANPRVAGELKIPGYSDFLLPLDDDHLLAIGKDAQEAGDWGAWVQGVQLSIFDVSDLANPRLKFKEIVGGRGTHSEANDNPKALTYDADRGAVAFPIDLCAAGTTGPEYGGHEFTGLLVYGVSADTGFAALGRLQTVPEGPPPGGCWWGYYGSTRGVFIGDHVYAVSDLGVKSAAIDAASTVLDEVTFSDGEASQSCGYVDILPIEAGGLR